MFKNILDQKIIGRKKYASIVFFIFFSYPLQLAIFVGIYYMLRSIIPYDVARIFFMIHPFILSLALIPFHNRRLADIGNSNFISFFIPLFQILFYVIFGLGATVLAQSDHRVNVMNTGIIIFLISIFMIFYLMFKEGKNNNLNI